jgi:hypothetical protein
MKILIIGGGIFGLTTFMKLISKKYDCILLEKEKKIMLGASTNNLNRVHLGYHYPRDYKTAQQSKLGSKSFINFYRSSIIKYFQNYYLISRENTLTKFKDYLKFCKKNGLSFKVVKNINFFTKINEKFNNIEGIIKVQEPIYSWDLIVKIINKKIKKINKKRIFTNSEVLNITKKKNIFHVKTKKKIHYADVVIDASYFSLNYRLFENRRIKNYFKKIFYQITLITEINIKNIDMLGLAVMDGPFFSLLPKGNHNEHLLYHVKHSVIKESQKLTKSFLNLKKKNFLKSFNKTKIFLSKELNYFLPKLEFKFTNNFFISKRVLFKNKNDSRISSVLEPEKNYFLIASAKVDHSVDIANQLVEKITKRQ